jgi:hypothetical protein
LSNTTLPRSSLSVHFSPLKSLSVKSGARAPSTGATGKSGVSEVFCSAGDRHAERIAGNIARRARNNQRKVRVTVSVLPSHRTKPRRAGQVPAAASPRRDLSSIAIPANCTSPACYFSVAPYLAQPLHLQNDSRILSEQAPTSLGSHTTPHCRRRSLRPCRTEQRESSPLHTLLHYPP